MRRWCMPSPEPRLDNFLKLLSFISTIFRIFENRYHFLFDSMYFFRSFALVIHKSFRCFIVSMNSNLRNTDCLFNFRGVSWEWLHFILWIQFDADFNVSIFLFSSNKFILRFSPFRIFILILNRYLSYANNNTNA